jgi:hypothetical protein
VDFRAENCKVSEQGADLDLETEEQARRALLEEELVNIPIAKCGIAGNAPKKPYTAPRTGLLDQNKQRPTDLYDRLYHINIRFIWPPACCLVVLELRTCPFPNLRCLFVKVHISRSSRRRHSRTTRRDATCQVGPTPENIEYVGPN